MVILECNRVTKQYQQTRALDGFDLRLEQGQMLGLLGVNGAGKSTLINLAAGCIRPTSGRLAIFGTALDGRFFEYKRSTGFVLERPVWFEQVSIHEYLFFAGVMFGLTEHDALARTDELIDYFDLDKQRDVRIKTYSNGMKKKVSLAAALIHHPRLLILDEPFEGMDPISLEHSIRILLELKSRGVTIMIASHLLDAIEKLCDEIVIIDKGRNICQASVGAIAEVRKPNGTGSPIQTIEELFLAMVDRKPHSPLAISWDARPVD